VSADRKPACAAQRIGRLLFQWRSLMFHKVWAPAAINKN
jgi:hypothetical protein